MIVNSKNKVIKGFTSRKYRSDKTLKKNCEEIYDSIECFVPPIIDFDTFDLCIPTKFKLDKIYQTGYFWLNVTSGDRAVMGKIEYDTIDDVNGNKIHGSVTFVWSGNHDEYMSLFHNKGKALKNMKQRNWID